MTQPRPATIRSLRTYRLPPFDLTIRGDPFTVFGVLFDTSTPTVRSVFHFDPSDFVLPTSFTPYRGPPPFSWFTSHYNKRHNFLPSSQTIPPIYHRDLVCFVSVPKCDDPMPLPLPMLGSTESLSPVSSMKMVFTAPPANACFLAPFDTLVLTREVL